MLKCHWERKGSNLIFWFFSNLVDRILNNTNELKQLMKRCFQDLTPYPPLLSKERGNKRGKGKRTEFCPWWQSQILIYSYVCMHIHVVVGN
jgi:hypothetical protein